MSKRLSMLEIERFAIHDGPGIRTVVFLQGCPLRCSWCCNPESQKLQAQLLYFEDKCKGSGTCVEVCPEPGAIIMKNDRPVFNREICTSCMICVDSCLQNAIRFAGKQVSATDIMHVVLRDKAYYVSSGGGVTFSGGEPFMQFDGLMELLRLAKQEGLHTAVETCGQVRREQIAQALPFIDLLLFDIKHTDKLLLKQETGADADIILDNLRYISSIVPEKIIIRIPVLPGFNFNAHTIDNIFNIALAYQISEVHLLPYHTLGTDKYHQLGLDYTFPVDKILLKELLSVFKIMGEEKGLKVQIGG